MVSAPRVEFTNCAPRLHTLCFPDCGTMKIGPGATFELSESDAELMRKSAAFRAGKVREGVVQHPKGRIPDLSKGDEATAIRIISAQKDITVIDAWTASEKRGSVLIALMNRKRELIKAA